MSVKRESGGGVEVDSMLWVRVNWQDILKYPLNTLPPERELPA
jgi:hypothetical protein